MICKDENCLRWFWDLENMVVRKKRWNYDNGKMSELVWYLENFAIKNWNCQNDEMMMTYGIFGFESDMRKLN